MGKHKNRYAKEVKLFVPEATLDYHDMGILTSFDIEKLLTDFLEDSYINKYQNVLIVTGKGQIVRPLVQRLLKHNKHVESFKSAGYFNGQEGAFEIHLKNM